MPQKERAIVLYATKKRCDGAIFATKRTCNNALCLKKNVRWGSMPQLERVMVLYAIESTCNNALCHKKNMQ